ncbi:hypothetical protein GC169_04335 [bacterium]|nr:hypothetical protein [bacterium]
MKGSALWLVTFDGASAVAYHMDRANRRVSPAAFGARDGERKPVYRDGQATTYQSFSTERGAGDPKTDKEREIEDAFVVQLVTDLEAARAEGAFGALIVAAAPRAMGAFRRAAPEALRACLKLEAPVNLVNTPAADVYAAMERYL